MSKLIVTIVAVFSVGVLSAQTLKWQNPSSGVFSDAVNWKNADGDNVPPTGDDRLEFLSATQPSEIQIGADTTVHTLYFKGTENSTNNQLFDFHLNNHTLTVTNLFDVYHHIKHPDSRVTFRDGTLTATSTCKFNLDKDMWSPWGGSLFMTNVVFSYPNNWSVYSKGYPSVIQFEGGSQVTLKLVSDQRTGTASVKPRLVVTGKDTHLTSTEGLSIYSSVRWEFLDGAKVTTTGLILGGWAPNSETLISNATVTANNISITAGGNNTNTYVLITGGSSVTSATSAVTINNCTNTGSGNKPPHDTTLEVTGDSSLTLSGEYEKGTLEFSRWTGYHARFLLGDATVTATMMRMGAYGGTAGATSNDYMRVYGPRARMTVSSTSGSAISICYGATLDYVIPLDGFEQVPLEATAGGCTTTDNPLDASLRNRLVINADAFTRKHPQTRVTLMTTAKDSSVAFETLKTNFIYAGKTALKGEVSYDATHLYYMSAKIPGMVLLFR